MLADRRAVTGRSRPFDELLKLHQERRGQQAKKGGAPKAGPAPPLAPPTTAAVKSDSSAVRTGEERWVMLCPKEHTCKPLFGEE